MTRSGLILKGKESQALVLFAPCETLTLEKEKSGQQQRDKSIQGTSSYFRSFSHLII